MNAPLELYSTQCAICKWADNSHELYAATLSNDAFSSTIFSARRLPDRIHYRIVRCNVCGLVRSDPVADYSTISQLYASSTFDYEGELAGLIKTYSRYLAMLDTFGVAKGTLLEIGCGNGFFLEAALGHGYESVTGVEPSEHAIAQSAPHIREHILCGMMSPGLFEPDSFDVICMFQVFDHISDPNALLEECSKVLKGRGMILFLNHNVEALSAKILKERSPIIDVEHMYLFSPKTMSRLVTQHGFTVLKAQPAVNTYSLTYLMRLLPLPGRFKHQVLSFIAQSPLGSMPLSVPLGNLVMIAQKTN